MSMSFVTTQPAKILIVNYHYCVSENGLRYKGLRGVSPEIIDKQFATLQNSFEAVQPAELPLDKAGTIGSIGYLVTFDDGSKDIFENAVPLLNKYRTPALLFCCSAPYLDGCVLNVQKTHLLQGKWGWDRFRKKFFCVLENLDKNWQPENTSRLNIARMYRYDDEKTACFKRLLNTELPYCLLDKVLDHLFESEFGPQHEVVRYLYMSLDDLKRCRDDGFDIGLHSHSHKFLSRLNAAEQEREFSLPFAFFSDVLEIDITAHSYPYGIRGSWNDTTKSMLDKYGLQTAYTLGRVLYDPDLHVDPFEIPRFDVNDVFTLDGELNEGIVKEQLEIGSLAY